MAADLERDVASLHPLEVKVLRAFPADAPATLALLAADAGLDVARARSAVERLREKGAVEVAREEGRTVASLTDRGRDICGRKLLALRILDLLATAPPGAPPLNRDTLVRHPAVAPDEVDDVGSAIGDLKRLGTVAIGSGGALVLASPDAAAPLAATQALVERIGRAEAVALDALDAADRERLEGLSRKRGKGRGVFVLREERERWFALSPAGEALRAAADARGLRGDEISQLTPELLASGGWRSSTFRPYDVTLRPSRVVVGRRHPYREFLDDVKRRLLAMGFAEMRGSLVETEFWNMDALFMPQFHSAREIHDVYFVKQPTHCRDLPADVLDRVAAVHEHGGATGSRGWRYAFDRERTRRLVLRSQGTVLSARWLARASVPGKYFSIARCFRYDTVDATHAPDFFQIEGIVLEDGITFRHLLGLLTLFAREIARAEEIRFVPAYFPFTEPSVEIHMRHPNPRIGWTELGGAGIFRPEVTWPQGVDVPVIAWGLGLDRMAMVALEIDDIRDLFTPDLEMVRTKRVPL
jgi:phenylalanyl-tRNA synthetase alpha chain